MRKRLQVFSQNSLLYSIEDRNAFELDLRDVLTHVQKKHPRETIDSLTISVLIHDPNRQTDWIVVATILTEGLRW
jgi:hypothetical protein